MPRVRSVLPLDLTRHVVMPLAALLAIAGIAGCSSPATPSPPTQFTTVDLRVGAGPIATAGRIVTVDYTGWLHDPDGPEQKGAQFDSSLDPGREPLVFLLGAGLVIQGWDLGVSGMQAGGLRRLTIPPNLAYGAGGRGLIPPNATLVFDIELLDVR